MADPAGRLAERRRLDSQTKAARVIAALDAMAASGTALSSPRQYAAPPAEPSHRCTR
jgi:hypothetical protein